MSQKINRNDPCSCGSGLKYKKCCLEKDNMWDVAESLEDKILNETFRYIESFDSEHILNMFIGLQLMPENHGKNIRIEKLARHLALNLNHGNSEKLVLLKQHLDKEFAFDMSEDLPENLFCENIVFFGGNYTIFPGISSHVVEIFTNLTETVFHYKDDLPSGFVDCIYPGVTLMLNLGELLVRKTAYHGNIEGIETNSKFDYPAEGADFSITEIELANIFLQNGIKPHIIDDFMIFPEDKKYQLDDPDLNPLLYYPIVKFNSKYYFLMLSNQVGAMNEYILRMSRKWNCDWELVAKYHELVWHKLWGACDRMHWHLLDMELPENRVNTNLKERVFQFDTNRLAYVCYIYDNKVIDKYTLAEQEDFWDKHINERIKEVIDWFKTDEQWTDYKFLSLITYSSIGQSIFLDIEKEQEKELRLTFSAFDLIQLSQTEEWNSLSLWKFAKAFSILSQTTKSIASACDIYSLYKAKDESFYLSDERKPDLLSVVPGDGSHLLKESKLKQNLHGVINRINRRMVYVPVIKAADYAPLYCPQYDPEGCILCLDVYETPIWIINNQAGNRSMVIHARTFVEAISFWLYKLKNDIQSFIKSALTSFLQIEVILDEDLFKDTTCQEMCSRRDKEPYGSMYEDNTIRFYIRYSSLYTLKGGQNEGERMMMKALLNSFNLINGNSFSSGFIDGVIDKIMPLGNAKMILLYDTQSDFLIENRWLISPLYMSKTETNILLDELPVWLENKCKIPVKIRCREEKKELFNRAVQILLTKLEEEIKIFDFKNLLKLLISIHETLVWKREHNKIIIPAQILCFGEEKHKVKEMLIEGNKLISTSLSLRCLIEYLAASPTKGKKTAAYDDIDRLLTLMHELINYGFLSDLIHFQMADPEVGRLKSGRLGISRDFFEEKLQLFAVANIQEEIANYLENFQERLELPDFSLSEEGEKNELFNEVDRAFLDDWKIGYGNIYKFCYTCAVFCMENKSSVISMKESQFIEMLINRAEISREEIIAGIDHFTLENRINYLIAPAGFNNNEVFPWKYNREFSFARRFLVRYTDEDGGYSLIWGFRNAISAQKQLHYLLLEGKLNNGGKKIDKILGVFRAKKGKAYRDKVTYWLKMQDHLEVLDYEVKISIDGPLKADKNYGDIDILVYDKKAKIILSLECKDTDKAKNIHEMKKEMDNYLGREGGKGMVQKHLARHDWLQENKQQLCNLLKIDVIKDIRSFMLTSEIIPTSYIKAEELPLPIVAFPDLRQKGMNLLLA